MQAVVKAVSSEFWEGCGLYTVRATIFRKQADLKRMTGGIVHKPPPSDFLLIPQRPYLSMGTLRDQVIYPHSKAEMATRAFPRSVTSLNGD
jgi:ATP-binding cassette subfamily D (ALD) long-chain fatty acid import protein